jgi:nitrite reductase/ring-hydroxylating ferredoxin subunit
MTDAQPSTMTKPQQEEPSRPGIVPTRRAVLVGSGALGATCLLAACGTEATPTPAPLPAGSPDVVAATGGSDTGVTTLAAVKDVPSGSGVIKGEYVITQPSEGTFKAFSSICTHAQCNVTNVEGGTINCKCHNSKFSIEDGSPQSGPAKKPLPETKVKVDGDNIVAA